MLKVIVEDDERFYESDWFKALEYNFDNSAVKDLKTYLKNMSEDIRNIDLDSLNETVQKMLHNQLNNKVVEAWEVADGNHSKTN